MDPKPLQRDVFVSEIFNAAKKNKDIYFLCADLGAKALDDFRVELPNQFIHVGISEQNMMDVAAGLALNGKTVYTYAMAPFVTLRCFEQIKVALASMNLPVTVVGVGAGYSYDDAGPTHYATEDISCMRSLAGIEIYTTGDTRSTIFAAQRTLQKAALSYVRLDRKHLPDVYAEGDVKKMEQGLAEVDAGRDVCLFTCGYMLQKARKVRSELQAQGIQVAIVDVFRLKPLNVDVLASIAQRYPRLAVLEEHFLSGGLASCLLEGLADAQVLKPVLRMGIEEHYYCENGGRDYLHKLAGIDVDTVAQKLAKFCRSTGRETGRGLSGQGLELA